VCDRRVLKSQDLGRVGAGRCSVSCSRSSFRARTKTMQQPRVCCYWEQTVKTLTDREKFMTVFLTLRSVAVSGRQTELLTASVAAQLLLVLVICSKWVCVTCATQFASVAHVLHAVVFIGHEWLGGHLPGKPGKIREFHIGQEEVGEIRKSQGHCGLRVMWYRSCDSRKTNITWVLLSKVVNCHAQDGLLIGPQYLLRSIRRPVCIPLVL